MQKIPLLQDKHILLGVTGSIAAYKAVDLASKLTQAGAMVDVIMTESARKFVSHLTFQSVTGRPVYDNLWQAPTASDLATHIAHVGLGESADLFVIAPATANTIAKLSYGMADDFIGICGLTVRCPILIAPAMDGNMYEHPATQENILRLTERGVTLIEPEVGRFASGLIGQGRFPETDTLLGHIRKAVGRSGIMAGYRALVTAGGTQEPIDPVRYITNRSSGKQGHAIAQAAIDSGSDVTLITTTRDIAIPVGAKVIMVETAEEMLNAVTEQLPQTDVLVMAAAVADFKPEKYADQKIKKNSHADAPVIQLSKTADILENVQEYRAKSGFPRVTVGFAAESENLLENAKSKLVRKGLDLLFANNITQSDAGFSVDTNRGTLIFADGTTESIALQDKLEIGYRIMQEAYSLLTVKKS